MTAAGNGKLPGKVAVVTGAAGQGIGRVLRAGPIALARVGALDEIAPAAVLLVPDDGSFMTASDLADDGGQGAW